MPNSEEIANLVGDKKPEGESPNPVVSADEYQKVVESYENLRSLESRRDNEIKELREKAKRLDDLESNKSKVYEDEESEEEELEILRSKLKKLNVVPLSEVEKEVEMRLKVQDAAKNLMTDIQKAVSDYPFVKEQEVLDFIRERKGNVSVKEALMLRYSDQFLKSKVNEDDIVETDGGGRTIKSAPVVSIDDSEIKGIKDGPKGSGRSLDVASWISKRATSRLNEENGVK